MTGRLEALTVGHPLPTWRPVARTVAVLLAILLVWANFAQLDEVSSANGEVIPQGKVKVIQHFEGGIIQNIYVAEGDMVKTGTPLVQLDLGTAGVNREELAVRIDGLTLTSARLEAEANGRDLQFPEDVAKRRPQFVANERQAFEARRKELASKRGVLADQLRQRELEVQELEARLRATSNNLKLAQERFKMSTSLVKEGLTAKMEHLQLEAEVEKLQGEMKALETSVPRARVAVEEATGRLNETDLAFRRAAQEDFNKTEQDLARAREIAVQATEQGLRSEIKSPIDGVVKNLRYHTIGGVVRSGEPIMEIVPTGENLVIEAKLNPVDRGYVTTGQKATVKVSTYDFVRYGGLDGTVIHVAPDSSTDPKGEPYFRVVVQTEKTYLGEAAGKLPITPGMQATVDIHTGKKSVMEYLVKPVLKLRHEAFRER
jgi:adhesin transport system membrane fusion protein